MQLTSATQLIPLIEVAIGPVIIISGVVLFLFWKNHFRTFVVAKMLTVWPSRRFDATVIDAQPRILMRRASLICIAISLISINAACTTVVVTEPGRPLSDIQYQRYRDGQIRRHITSNGRYLEYVWLKTWDSVDRGYITWPDQHLQPDVKVSIREPYEDVKKSWLPVAYWELLPRIVPPNYRPRSRLGFVARESGLGRIPLYEWIHNRLREEYVGIYADHVYSTNVLPEVARYRYHQTGIIGYVLKDAAPGFHSLYSGYSTKDRNHYLFIDKSNPMGLVNVIVVGYISDTLRSDFDAEFWEYRSETGSAYLDDALYSAHTQEVMPIDPSVSVVAPDFRGISSPRHNASTSSSSSVAGSAGVVNKFSKHHFLARLGVAGGGDNPLYEGGLALATFSLEHLHEVSPQSLGYAKVLFEFIENSEELGSSVLTGGVPVPTGYLRRSRHPWWMYPDDQYGGGQKWGASTDELVGVIFGLKYFIRATHGDSTYNVRAKQLLGRIASYLKNHGWIYADPRITPKCEIYTAESYRADTHPEEGGTPMINYGVGTLAFIYPFSHVFEDALGDSYQISFDALKYFASCLRPADAYWGEIAISFQPVLSCVLEYEPVASWVLDHFGVGGFDYQCGAVIDTHREVYRAAVENAAPLTYYLMKEQNKTDGFFNHAMLAYTALLVLDSSSVPVDHKTELAKVLYRYVFDMWGADYHFHWVGIGRRNALLGVVAKRAADFLNHDRKLDALDLDMRSGYVITKFEGEINRVLDYASWFQDDLPLGEPAFSSYSGRPWETNLGPQGWEPDGWGRNHAWRNPNEKFTIWKRAEGISAKEVFEQIGPYYARGNSGWSESITLARLRQYARVGYRSGEPEYDSLSWGAGFEGLHFKVEAGGNDLMLLRMLLVDMGVGTPPVLTNKNETIPVLGVEGETPW